MTDLHISISKYMAEVFRTIQLIDNNNLFINISYHNPIFSIEYKKDHINYTVNNNFCFSTNLFKSLCKLDSIQLKIQRNDNDSIVNSEECIPARFFYMIKDFHIP